MDFGEELKSLKEQLSFKETIEDSGRFDNIVIAGQGGSGISGKIFQEIYSKKPVIAVDDYSIPDFVSERTLFIAMSYSGNTEEAISCLGQAKAKGAYTIAVSSRGKLEGQGDRYIKIPRSDLQPRSSLGYMLMPLARGFGLIDEDGIKRAYGLLKALDDDNSECLSYAKTLYEGKLIPIIYGSKPFRNVAYRWKTEFNENSKVSSYSANFPELDHNDIVALADTYRKEEFYIFVFSSSHERIKKRIGITEQIGKVRFNIIKPKGQSDIEQILYLIHYGDYVSHHLAKLRGIDTAEVKAIDQLKKEL